MRKNIQLAFILCLFVMSLNVNLHAQIHSHHRTHVTKIGTKSVSPLVSFTTDNGHILVNKLNNKATYKNASGSIPNLTVSSKTYAFRKKKDIINMPVQLDKSAIFIERNELLKINDTKDKFSISMIVHFETKIEDNTTLWEFYDENSKIVNMGLYVNKDSSLYLKLSRASLKLSHFNISGKDLNYKLPIYAPARVDSQCLGNNPKWFRITTIFTPLTVLVYISKPCETYYKGNGKLDYKANRDMYKAQDKNHNTITDLDAGYGGNYGNLGEQYYWTGNTQQNGWTHFVIGDKECKQSTKIDLYSLDFFDVILLKNQVKALDR